jgi:hypothetical protein
MTHRLTLIASAVFALTLFVPRVSLADPRTQLEGAVTLLADYGKFEEAAELQGAIDAIPDDQLQYIYGGLDWNGLLSGLDAALSAVADEQELAREMAAGKAASTSLDSSGAGSTCDPNSSWSPACPATTTSQCSQTPNLQDGGDIVDLANGNLIGTQAVEGLMVLMKAARSITLAASRVCNQTAVVAGEGGNTSVACIPVDIIFALLEGGVESAKVVLDYNIVKNRVDWYCNGAVTGARVKATYQRLELLKEIVEDDAAEIDGRIDEAREELQNDLRLFQNDVDLRLAELQASVNTVLTILKGNGLSRYGGARWTDAYYRDGGAEKLAEACVLAQDALTHAKQTYQVGMRAQMLIDRGNKLISSETSPQLPHEGFEACRTAYRLATDKSYKLNN